MVSDLLEAVAVDPEVVGEALELVRAELFQGVPLALGKLKVELEECLVTIKIIKV